MKHCKVKFEQRLDEALGTMAGVFKASGKKNMQHIYGDKAKFKRMVSSRYTKQPWYELEV